MKGGEGKGARLAEEKKMGDGRKIILLVKSK